jgi:hypothetical protein
MLPSKGHQQVGRSNGLVSAQGPHHSHSCTIVVSYIHIVCAQHLLLYAS